MTESFALTLPLPSVKTWRHREVLTFGCFFIRKKLCTIASLFTSLKKKRITKNEEKGEGEAENEEQETGKRRNGEQRRGNGERRRKNGERDTRNGDQEPGTEHGERENENGKNRTPKLNQQIITHSLFCSHFSISRFPFSVLVIPAPYNMNHQILLMAFFATRNEGLKQENQCTDAFLFISSKRFLSYFFVLKSKGLVIYLVGW